MQVCGTTSLARPYTFHLFLDCSLSQIWLILPNLTNLHIHTIYPIIIDDVNELRVLRFLTDSTKLSTFSLSLSTSKQVYSQNV